MFVPRDVQASEKQMRKLLSGVCFVCLASGAMAPWTGSGTKTPRSIDLGAAHMMKTTSCVETNWFCLFLYTPKIFLMHLQMNVSNNDFRWHGAHLSVIYLIYTKQQEEKLHLIWNTTNISAAELCKLHAV